MDPLQIISALIGSALGLLILIIRRTLRKIPPLKRRLKPTALWLGVAINLIGAHAIKAHWKTQDFYSTAMVLLVPYAIGTIYAGIAGGMPEAVLAVLFSVIIFILSGFLAIRTIWYISLFFYALFFIIDLFRNKPAATANLGSHNATVNQSADVRNNPTAVVSLGRRFTPNAVWKGAIICAIAQSCFLLALRGHPIASPGLQGLIIIAPYIAGAIYAGVMGGVLESVLAILAGLILFAFGYGIILTVLN